MYQLWTKADERLSHGRALSKMGYLSPISDRCGDDLEQHGISAVLFAGAFRRHFARTLSLLLTVAAFVLLVSHSFTSCHSETVDPPSLAARTLTHYARAVVAPFLEVFQVYPPVLTVTPSGVFELTDGSTNATVDVIGSHRPTCQETLVVHSFAFSYGVPYVGNYTPPSCSFNRVTWNLTVVSAGRQFDRLGIVYLGDIEVFRTSTAEPTANGIEWTYLKDMTNYLPLLKQDQKIIFDLGNLINSIYTASFNVTLTAAFFTAQDSITPADLILPISARQSGANMPSVFTVPPQTASNLLTMPRNVIKAVFTIAATGQSEEEFWWSNVLQSEVNTFPQTGIFYGYSPFREVQLLIDGVLAGVAWPFPIIFTGGIVPGLWRPIVGIDAFDLKEDEIDITPWLPRLCDGNSHNFTIRVSGLNDDGNGTATLSETTNSYWLITGKVFIWLDRSGAITTGSGPQQSTPAPSFQVSSSIGKTGNGTNDTLLYQVNARRQLSFESIINTSHGSKKASWQQDLTYSNNGNLTDAGNVEVNTQNTNGVDISSSGYSRKFGYPLFVYSAFTTFGDNYSIVADVNRGKFVDVIGRPVFPTGLESFSVAAGVHEIYPSFEGASLATTQNGSATFIANQTSSTSFSFGTTEQDMVFAGVQFGQAGTGYSFPKITSSKELFHRHVIAINGTVVQDEETLVESAIVNTIGQPGDGRGFSTSGVRGTLGRGPEGSGVIGQAQGV